MAREKFYSEDVLIEKVQNGEFGWLDYVNHFSKEWKDEYERYCRTRGITISDIAYMIESALKRGNITDAQAEELLNLIDQKVG